MLKLRDAEANWVLVNSEHIMMVSGALAQPQNGGPRSLLVGKCVLVLQGGVQLVIDKSVDDMGIILDVVDHPMARIKDAS